MWWWIAGGVLVAVIGTVFFDKDATRKLVCEALRALALESKPTIAAHHDWLKKNAGWTDSDITLFVAFCEKGHAARSRLLIQALEENAPKTAIGLVQVLVNPNLLYPEE